MFRMLKNKKGFEPISAVIGAAGLILIGHLMYTAGKWGPGGTQNTGVQKTGSVVEVVGAAYKI